MKQLTCEVCGGTDLIKQEGVFVCQSCGCKYSVDEVKKLMVQITEPIKVDGVSTVCEKLRNVKHLISLGKLHEAEDILEILVGEAPNNPELWLVYSEFSFAKYVQSNNYDKYRESCTCDGGIHSVYNNPRLSLLERCKKSKEDIVRYMGNALKTNNTNTYQKDFEEIISKVNEIELNANLKDDEIYNYLYSTPCSYEFDYFYRQGCFPKLLYSYKGLNYKFDENAYGVIQKFIDECENNIKAYHKALNNDLNSEQWYLLRDKIVIYLCGQDALATIKDKFCDNGFYIGNSGQIPTRATGTKWDIVGLNGYTVSIKPFYPDAHDRKITVYPTSIQIKNNIDEIINDASKVNVKINKIKPQGCYIASSIYGSYDCPQVWTLRRFRDNTLAKSWYGRAFIKIYYTISPTLVKWFGHTKPFKRFWRKNLDKMVRFLNENGIKNDIYKDCERKENHVQ